jgi:hypothetical protein
MKYCRHCKSINGDDTHCRHCGALLPRRPKNIHISPKIKLKYPINPEEPGGIKNPRQEKWELFKEYAPIVMALILILPAVFLTFGRTFLTLGRTFDFQLFRNLYVTVTAPIENTYHESKEGDPFLKIWVNPAVRIYYCPGDQAFGNTVPGFYATQKEARASGYKTNSFWGSGCGTAARPLRTYNPVYRLWRTDYTVSLVPAKTVGARFDGLILAFQNRSGWEFVEITIWVLDHSGSKQYFALPGSALPFRQTDFNFPSGIAPADWGIYKLRGYPPH